MAAFDKDFLKTTLASDVRAHLDEVTKALDAAPDSEKVDRNRVQLHLDQALSGLHTAADHLDHTAPKDPAKPMPAPEPDRARPQVEPLKASAVVEPEKAWPRAEPAPAPTLGRTTPLPPPASSWVGRNSVIIIVVAIVAVLGSLYAYHHLPLVAR